MTNEPVPTTWDDWRWPEWVPELVRAAVRGYWHYGSRGPAHWLADAKHRGAPEFGQHVEVAKYAGLRTEAAGRYIHCHTNVGRVVHGDRRISLVFVMHDAVHFVKTVGLSGKG
ncbi:hypothetical protein LWC34_38960 [Kibdelosporangium philippinense]|uniref:Uncharacterized protein n=1 Tax=Kibdelosporangium philippinense TaxID=211113 RepID=A0ABS8ZLT2_9PSEU|nr:hypothetical protein [Kibdelosporangium philippinense]MCE7008751.1 hypothetical protein [Kibdelosporangium philippinense]